MLNKIYQNIEIRSNSEINQNWSKKYVTWNNYGNNVIDGPLFIGEYWYP